MANLIEMASRGASTLVDNLDEKKVTSSDCAICFATLDHDIDAYVKGAASVGTRGLSGIDNPPMPVTKSRRESRFNDCTEGHASKKARVVPTEQPPLDVCEMFNQKLQCFEQPAALKKTEQTYQPNLFSVSSSRFDDIAI